MEKAQMHEVKTALSRDYTHCWKLLTDKPIDIERLNSVVVSDIAKIKICLRDGLDIGGIIQRKVPVVLGKNKANGVSFVWDNGTEHWYPILQYKQLWKTN